MQQKNLAPLLPRSVRVRPFRPPRRRRRAKRLPANPRPLLSPPDWGKVMAAVDGKQTRFKSLEAKNRAAVMARLMSLLNELDTKWPVS